MFKNPFSFEGRIRRTEYGLTFIIYLVVYFIMLVLMDLFAAGSLIVIVLVIPLLWFFWAQGAKRCHDIGRSGWMQIIPFYFFFLLFESGAEGVNDYGANPKDPNQVVDLKRETLDGHLRS